MLCTTLYLVGCSLVLIVPLSRVCLFDDPFVRSFVRSLVTDCTTLHYLSCVMLILVMLTFAIDMSCDAGCATILGEKSFFFSYHLISGAEVLTSEYFCLLPSNIEDAIACIEIFFLCSL